MPDFGADSDTDMIGGDGAKDGEAPSSMIVQFSTLEGEDKGPQIDIPLDSTVLQMEELMNQLLENQDKVGGLLTAMFDLLKRRSRSPHHGSKPLVQCTAVGVWPPVMCYCKCRACPTLTLVVTCITSLEIALS